MTFDIPRPPSLIDVIYTVRRVATDEILINSVVFLGFASIFLIVSHDDDEYFKIHNNKI